MHILVKDISVTLYAVRTLKYHFINVCIIYMIMSGRTWCHLLWSRVQCWKEVTNTLFVYPVTIEHDVVFSTVI